MPVFEFNCKQCHKVHEILYSWKYGDGFNYLDDPDFQVCPVNDEHGFIDLVPSVASMQPDDCWAGINTEYGYFTSKAKLKDRIGRNAQGEKVEKYDVTSRADREYLDKHCERASQELDAKGEVILRDTIGKELQEWNASLDYSHIVDRSLIDTGNRFDMETLGDNEFEHFCNKEGQDLCQ